MKIIWHLVVSTKPIACMMPVTAVQPRQEKRVVQVTSARPVVFPTHSCYTLPAKESLRLLKRNLNYVEKVGMKLSHRLVYYS